MKNIFVYYFLIIVPFIGVLFLSSNSFYFCLSLLVYIIYRSILDSERLIALEVISKDERLKMYFSLFKNGKYFRELYLK
jgi:hypothetical protein